MLREHRGRSEEALPHVKAPTLLVVGGNDSTVPEKDRRAMRVLRVDRKLAVVLGATNLFEGSGALEEVAKLAADWFVRHLYQTHRQPVTGLRRTHVQ